jgi:Butirosin biosynthesis protein H, N-terminal
MSVTSNETDGGLVAGNFVFRETRAGASAEPRPGNPGAAMEYHGNVAYCYGNSIAMLLSAGGEQIYPGLVEVLTGIGLGATRVPDGPTYFSTTPAQVPPGVDAALELLGCTFTASTGPEEARVEDLLRGDLATGPIVLGPLDMGHLTYIPWHRQVAGADHYVVAYGIDDDGVHIHDPAGFPCATLNFDDLSRAWRAERIGYEGGPYHRWKEIRRVKWPEESKLNDAALAYFAAIYRDRPSGGATIRRLAEDVRAGRIAAGGQGFLTAFALPLGVRRALDYALFFQRGGHAGPATFKHGQAEAFGRCLQAANRGDLAGVAAALEDVASHEDDLERALTS